MVGFKEMDQDLGEDWLEFSPWFGFFLSRVPLLVPGSNNVFIDVLKLTEIPFHSQGDSLLLKTRKILTESPSQLFISETQESFLERVGCHLIIHQVITGLILQKYIPKN